MFGRQESTRTDFKLDLALNSMAQKRRWSFTLDVMDYEEAWRWLHIDSNGAMTKSLSGFAHCYECQANAGQYGWHGTLMQKPDAENPAPWKSRYVVSVRNAVESFSFDELVLAVTYARSLPVGEVAEIADMGVPPGQLFSYIVASGTNVVGFNHSQTKAMPPVEEST